MAHKIARNSIVIFILLLLAGCATKSDINEAMHKLAPPIALEPALYAALRPTRNLDSDGDGKITKIEITKETERVYSQELQRADRNDDGQLSQYELIYARTNAPDAIIWTGMDEDKNGKISLDELNKFVRARVKEILREYDINKDRTVSQFEFVNKNQNTLELLDTDRNGYLDAREIAGSTRTQRVYSSGAQLAVKICTPGACVWTMPGGYYGNGSPGYQYEPISTFCDRYPDHSVCPSSSHPGCTNGDVSSGNCKCWWPDQCGRFI